MHTDLERVIECLVYVVRDTSGSREALLLHPKDGRNVGKWVPLGTAMTVNESPREAVERVLVGVGITPREILFRGLVTEVSPTERIQWLLFIYVAQSVEGNPHLDPSEGELRWWSVNDVKGLATPQSDAIFGPIVLNSTSEFYEATMHFDENRRLIVTQSNNK